jgi:uncharacterized protein (DUF1697 family)
MPEKPSIRYAAFLRGVNVGGNVLVKMADVKKLFEALGFENVQTILASGNILFESGEQSANKLASTIAAALEKKYKRAIGVIVRSIDELQKLADRRLFKNITVTPAKRLYITFLSEKPKSTLKIPYISPEKDFTILTVTNSEVISVLTVTEKRGTTDGMNIIEKEFGKNVTTRNWNTIEKILKK